MILSYFISSSKLIYIFIFLNIILKKFHCIASLNVLQNCGLVSNQLYIIFQTLKFVILTSEIWILFQNNLQGYCYKIQEQKINFVYAFVNKSKLVYEKIKNTYGLFSFSFFQPFILTIKFTSCVLIKLFIHISKLKLFLNFSKLKWNFSKL